MPRLIRIDTGADIGTISDAQLKFLVEQLEDEHAQDNDCYIDRATLELLFDNGGDSQLLAMLEKALGEDEEIEIAWE